MSVQSVMTALANAVRSLSGGSSALSLEGMTNALNAISRKAAATIQPGEETQTIAAGQFLTGTQTIGKGFASGTITVASDATQTIVHNLGRVPEGLSIVEISGMNGNGVGSAICLNEGLQRVSFRWDGTWYFEEITIRGGFIHDATSTTIKVGCPGYINLARTTFLWIVC